MHLIAATLSLLLATEAAAAAGALPDRLKSPGVARHLGQDEVCARKWSDDRRYVSARMKRQVFASYGLSGNRAPYCQPKGCEIDHVIPRELGGADVVANLFPQSYTGPWNARMKDRLENRLHREVCAGRLPLADAQRSISTDWRAAYRAYFGDPD